MIGYRLYPLDKSGHFLGVVEIVAPSDLVALDLDLALRHRLVIGQNGHRIVLVAVQLDHGTAAHAQQLMHGDDRTAQNYRDFDFDIIDIGSHGRAPYIGGSTGQTAGTWFRKA